MSPNMHDAWLHVYRGFAEHAGLFYICMTVISVLTDYGLLITEHPLAMLHTHHMTRTLPLST